MRKYFTEFGLNIYTSYKALIPVEHLKAFNNSRRYHIYMILSFPKSFIRKDSIVKRENSIDLELLEIEEEKEISYKVNDVVLLPYVNHKDLDIKLKYPYDKLICQVEKDTLKEVYGEEFIRKYEVKDIASISVPAYILKFNHYFKSNQILSMNVLYIGQAFGEDGERSAKDRLASHEKLQRILMDCHSNYPDRKLYLLLLEISDNLVSSFNPLAKQYKTTIDENKKHTKKVISDLPRYKQVINITEAALINYFKPKYNIDFVENFPSVKHTGYKQYFDLDYNCIVIELDLEFDDFPRLKLKTNYNKISSQFDIIKYNLFNDNDRENMYDIFK